MRTSVRATFFLSAFSPALISVAISRVIAGGIHREAIAFLFAGLFGVLLTTYIISAIQWEGEDFPIKVKKIKSNDTLMMGVVVSYFFPFLGKAADVSDASLVAILGVIYILFYFSNAILPSPLLRLLSYRFYEVESDAGFVYTLISNREILDPKHIKCVKMISRSMLLEVGIQ